MGASASGLAIGDDPSLADALVLDSGYSKLSNAIPGWWRFLGGKPLAVLMWPVVPLAAPMAGFNPYSVDVAKALEKVRGMPVLLFHGDKDDLVPPSEGERNQRACGGELLWLKDCGHTEGRWIHPELYVKTLTEFLAKRGLLDALVSNT
jgi:fermentation-respiration switch protein FrsA (DUF1100 family)